MKTTLNYIAPLLFMVLSAFSLSVNAQSVREERKLISEGTSSLRKENTRKLQKNMSRR